MMVPAETKPLVADVFAEGAIVRIFLRDFMYHNHNTITLTFELSLKWKLFD